MAKKPHYQKGDRVTCIENDGLESTLTKDDTLVVESYDCKSGLIKLKGIDTPLSHNRFKPKDRSSDNVAITGTLVLSVVFCGIQGLSYVALSLAGVLIFWVGYLTGKRGANG